MTKRQMKNYLQKKTRQSKRRNLLSKLSKCCHRMVPKLIHNSASLPAQCSNQSYNKSQPRILLTVSDAKFKTVIVTDNCKRPGRQIPHKTTSLSHTHIASSSISTCQIS